LNKIYEEFCEGDNSDKNQIAETSDNSEGLAILAFPTENFTVTESREEGYGYSAREIKDILRQ
jgi:hypothetical protein